jgi:hypothetical protein
VADSTPNPRLRGRIETVIGLAAPFLDLLIVVSDRVSRVFDRDDPDYALPRLAHDGESAPRGLKDYPRQ